MLVEWGGENLRVIASPTTGDLYHWRVVLMGNLFASDDTGPAINDALDFCARFIDAKTERLIVLSTIEATENKRTIWNLGELLFEATGYRRNEAVRDALRIQFGVKGYKPGSRARVCDCRACSGLLVDGEPVPFDANCKFTSAGVGPIDRDIAGLDAELIAKFWDRPHYLYSLACYENEFRALSDHKRSDDENDDHAHGGGEEAIRAKQRARLRKHNRR